MEGHILTECYVDTLLVEVVVPPARGYNHQHSCNKALRTMKTRFADRFAVGIMDDDKLVPKDFDDFRQIKTYNRSLALYKHHTRPHYVIKIIPASEQFILDAARQCNISPAAHSLPEDLKQFTSITKHKTAKESKELRSLLRAVKQSNAGSFNQLAEWIEQLEANPFNRDR